MVSPHGHSYIWTTKLAPVHVRGRLTAGGREFELDGDDAFMDESAGYHARHTAWRWSAGIGRAADGRAVAWNLVDGVHDAAKAASGRSGSTACRGRCRRRSSRTTCRAWASSTSGSGRNASRDRNLVAMRNRYRQPFGEFSGTLPGGLALAEGHGVMEEHDVLW